MVSKHNSSTVGYKKIFTSYITNDLTLTYTSSVLRYKGIYFFFLQKIRKWRKEKRQYESDDWRN